MGDLEAASKRLQTSLAALLKIYKSDARPSEEQVGEAQAISREDSNAI